MDLFDRVRKIADFMGLRTWGVSVEERPAEQHKDGAYASVVIGDQSEGATITFYAPFYALDEHDQRRVIVHECGHCVLVQIDELMDTYGANVIAMVKKIDPSYEITAECVHELFDDTYCVLRERVVDRFARVINDAAELGL